MSSRGLSITLSFCIILIISFCANALDAQDLNTFDTVNLVSGDIYTLNSVNKTNFGNGKNRNCMTYSLPQNTHSVLLRVLIDNSDFQVDKSNYQSLMSKYISTSHNPTLLLGGAAFIQALSPCSSGKSCDFYLPSTQKDKEKFIMKGAPWQYDVDQISYVRDYTRLNTQSFVEIINTDDLQNKEKLYLAFQNHSLTNACKVIIDIIAFVEKR